MGLQFGHLYQTITTTATTGSLIENDCATKWRQDHCKEKNKPEKDFIELETKNILQLCDSHWGYGQIYRRFIDMMEKPEHEGISVFSNAHVDHNGILEAIADLKKNVSLAKFGKSKSFRVYGGS